MMRVGALPAARALGLAHEHAAIAARFARVGAAWAPHLAASQRAILDGATRCRARQTALIVGAGQCLDVPVAELAGLFDRVLLVDVVICPAARQWARRFPGRVECQAWDATGALEAVARRRRTLTAPEAAGLFQRGCPQLPGGVEPDLVVSTNCVSQLGLIPAHALAG